MSLETTELVILAKQGNADAFGELYELYCKEMYAYARCVTGSEQLAQDAVSQAVLSAFKQIGSLKKVEAFKGWLFKILCACCKNVYNENIRRDNLIYLDDENTYSHLSSDDRFEIAVELKQALDTLSAEEKEIVLLNVTGGYKSHEISEILGIKPSTVRSKLKRALEKLRNELGEDYRRKGDKE